MKLQGVPIGVASTRSGVKVPTIRYYEEIGLLPKPPRTKANRRNYNAADLHRLVFIRHARELGSKSRQSAPCSPCRTIQISHAGPRM
jgi:DNA-binding transcriptional MerR regulator